MKKRKKVRKESSDRLSTIAARVLREAHDSYFAGNRNYCVILVKDAVALAGSVLSQDETKGKRKARTRAKRTSSK